MKEHEFYKCAICGSIIIPMNENGKTVCCGQDMELMEIKVGEEGTEKHKPIIEGNEVNVGSIDHPMTEEHYIQVIQLIKDGKVIESKYLYPGDKPHAKFSMEGDSARALCNIHGLWKNQ